MISVNLFLIFFSILLTFFYFLSIMSSIYMFSPSTFLQLGPSSSLIHPFFHHAFFPSCILSSNLLLMLSVLYFCFFPFPQIPVPRPFHLFNVINTLPASWLLRIFLSLPSFASPFIFFFFYYFLWPLFLLLSLPASPSIWSLYFYPSLSSFFSLLLSLIVSSSIYSGCYYPFF